MACFIGLLMLLASVASWAFAEELEPVRQMVRYWFGKIFKPAKKQIKVELPK